jgi:hypothetical protein
VPIRRPAKVQRQLIISILFFTDGAGSGLCFFVLARLPRTEAVRERNNYVHSKSNNFINGSKYGNFNFRSNDMALKSFKIFYEGQLVKVIFKEQK